MNDFKYVKKRRKKIFVALTNIDFKREKPLKVESIQDGYIVPPVHPFSWSKRNPGGVFDSKLNYVEISQDVDFGGVCSFNRNEAKYLNEKVIYFGAFIRHWGHFIADSISRLWILFNQKYHDYKIAYVPMREGEASDIDNQFLELFELLGIDSKRLIKITSLSKVKEIIVAERSLVTHDYVHKPYFTLDFINLANAIVLKCLGNYDLNNYQSDVLYIAHDLNASSKEVNIDYELEAAKQVGAKIIYPSKLSLKDQIRYINSTSLIMLTDGSVAHNLMFANQKIKVMMLNRFNLVNSRQLVINSLKPNLSIYYVDSYLQLFSVGVGTGPFFHYPTKLFKQMMEQQFNINFSVNNHFLKNFLKYIIFYLRTYSFIKTKKMFNCSPISIHKIIKSQKRTTKRLLEYSKKNTKQNNI